MDRIRKLEIQYDTRIYPVPVTKQYFKPLNEWIEDKAKEDLNADVWIEFAKWLVLRISP